METGDDQKIIVFRGVSLENFDLYRKTIVSSEKVPSIIALKSDPLEELDLDCLFRPSKEKSYLLGRRVPFGRQMCLSTWGFRTLN